MIAPDLISHSIPPLHLDDTGEQVLLAMHEYNVSQLPVVDGNSYIGLVTMEDVINMKHLNQPLKNFTQIFRKPSVKDTAHIFDVMKSALEYNVRVVPVINDDHKYLGMISAESCLRAFAVLNSVKDAGGILELQVAVKDYSLSEVARIVEENEAEILCLYTNINQLEQKAEITIKLNTSEVSGIIAAFERYEYEVISVYNDAEYAEDMKDRYDLLMRYLNV
ncbi:MAG: CBS domain-containing protein [Bacteroidetes bacterium]|nr:CBS domain-containing protein [Bacteroidota bacterium]